MTDGDDRLDPVLADRFRALDDVLPPDTWPAAAAGPVAGARRWPLLAAAAAVVLIVGAIAVLARDGADEVIVGAPGTTPVTANTTAATASTVYVVEDALATAEPAVVRPGEQITVTPAAVVQQYCDKVNVIGPTTGTIMGGQWNVVDPVTATYSCDGPLSDAPVAVTVPPLATGDYRFCVAVGDVPEGCARVSVVAAAEELPEALATAEPAVVSPGQPVTLTPAGTVERYCADIVAVLPAADGPILGQILEWSGWQPVPAGAPGPTWPACLGDVTADPITVPVPAIADGDYRFCIAAGEVPEGCALVTVVAAPQELPEALAVAEPAVAAPGQQVVITPAGVIERHCNDVVDVYAPEGDTLLGQVSGGRSWTPVVDGGPPPTWLACAPDPTDAPLTVTVPPVADGTYRFCLRAGAVAEGCARVDVLATSLLAVASPGEAAPGDAITITPAAAIERICTGWVRVFDVRLSAPVAEIVDPATGETQAPAFGGWEALDCAPQTSGALVDVVVPDLDVGGYAFCLSAEPEPDACALVDVVRRAGPATASNVPAGPIVIVGGLFPAADSSVFGLTSELVRANTVEIEDRERPPWACSLMLDRVWLTTMGGLEIVWEGDDFGSAFAGNWRYVGGPVLDREGMVTDRGVTVGSSRADVLAAYPEIEDDADEVFAPGFRIGFDGDTVAWLGNVQCGP